MTARTMAPEPITVDFVARVADAWDGRGKFCLRAPSEHLALLSLCFLPAELQSKRWAELTPNQRVLLVKAARLAVELGRQCAYFFGSGEGARF